MAIGTQYLNGPAENLTVDDLTKACQGMQVGFQQFCQELAFVLGKEKLPLLHKYSVEFKDSLPAGASTAAVLEVANYPIPPQTNEDDLDDITNGFAFRVTAGKSCFAGPVCFDGSVTGLAANGAAVCWGKATADFTLGAVGWNSTVPVDVVTDRTGATTTGDTATVYLNRTDLQDPNVRDDDVIAFVMDENGLAFALDSQFDGKIGDLRFGFGITSPAGPPDYTAAAGYRGWRVADGTNGTHNMGGRVPYGWISGDATYGTVGTDVTNSSAGTISAHAVSGVDPTIASSITHSAIAAALTGTMTHAAIAAALAAASSGVAAASTFLIDREAVPGTAGDDSFISSLSDPGHSHTAAGGGPASVTIAAAGGGPATVTSTMTDDAVAGALATHTFTGGTVRPAGETVLILQRIS